MIRERIGVKWIVRFLMSYRMRYCRAQLLLLFFESLTFMFDSVIITELASYPIYLQLEQVFNNHKSQTMSFVQAVLVNTSRLTVFYWVPTEKNEINKKINPQFEVESDETSEQEIAYKTVVLAPGCYSREMVELADQVPFEVSALVKVDGRVQRIKFTKANYERVYGICEKGVIEGTSLSTFIKFPTPESIDDFKLKMAQQDQTETLTEGQIRKRVAYLEGKEKFLSLYQKNTPIALK